MGTYDEYIKDRTLPYEDQSIDDLYNQLKAWQQTDIDLYIANEMKGKSGMFKELLEAYQYYLEWYLEFDGANSEQVQEGLKERFKQLKEQIINYLQ